MRRPFVPLVCALVLAGCTTPAPEPTVPFDGPISVDVDGVERTYLLTPPADDGAALVIMLHGGQEDGVDARRDYNWDALAAREGFAVAYPDGIGGAWNAGDCCGQAQADAVDDVGFMFAIVNELAAAYSIDQRRVYATGFSNGALLAYRLACETDRFAAIAPVGGTIVVPCQDPAPTSVLHIHGAADTIVPLGGLIGAGQESIQGMSIDAANQLWRETDGCDAPVVAVDGDVTSSLAQCAEGRAVELVTVAGAGHQWPGSLVLRSGIDAPSTAFDATSLIWDFLASHPAP